MSEATDVPDVPTDNPPPADDRGGLGEVLRISWPASVSMLNSTLMRFVDALMVSFVGAIPFSAQFMASMTAFIPESFAVGVLMVVNTYVAQNYGAGRIERCSQYAWAGLRLAGGFCLVIAPLALLARPIFTLMGQGPDAGQPPELIEQEIMYFRYVVLAIFFTLTARPIEQFFYGIHRPRIVLVGSIVANVLNIFGAYALIFGSHAIAGHWHGWFGWQVEFPFEWEGRGLEGAAIAMVASWIAYFLLLLIVFLSGPIHRQFHTRTATRICWGDIKDIFRTGWPAGVQFVHDIGPWVFMTALVSSFGWEHLAATSVAMRWMPLSFMPALGIGVAATALVGKYLGAGRPDLARRRTHTALKVTLVYMGLCGLAFLIFREEMVRFFVMVLPGEPGQMEQTPEQVEQIVRIGGWVMVCAALFQLFDAVGITYISALRGAGDTLGPMFIVICTSWTLVVGGGVLAVKFLPQLGSVGPWIAGSAYVVALGLLMAWRFERGGWRNIDLLRRDKQP